MDLDRDAVTEIAVSVGGVGLFLAALVVIGMNYNTDGFSSDGGLALVGLVIAFILVFTGIGWWLSTRH